MSLLSVSFEINFKAFLGQLKTSPVCIWRTPLWAIVQSGIYRTYWSMESTAPTKVTIPATHFGTRTSVKEGRGVILPTVNPTGLARLEGG